MYLICGKHLIILLCFQNFFLYFFFKLSIMIKTFFLIVSYLFKICPIKRNIYLAREKLVIGDLGHFKYFAGKQKHLNESMLLSSTLLKRI